LPLVVASITEANDYKIDFAAIAIGGRTLEEHAADSATMSAVSSGDYDIVIIQEQSMMPASAFLESSTIPSARRIADAANQSGARVVFYQTWAHQNGNLQIYHSSYASMRDALVTGYVRMAAEAGGEIAPAGLAWDRALSNPVPAAACPRRTQEALATQQTQFSATARNERSRASRLRSGIRQPRPQAVRR